MRAYQLHRGQGLAGLELVQRELPPPGPHEVHVRVNAAALNYRDRMLVDAPAGGPPLHPGSDGAGVVLAVGHAVRRVQAGQRVLANFFPHWLDGTPSPGATRDALGARGAGLFAEDVLLPAESLVAVPDGLSDLEAATLPCAGVTAWNALFEAGRARPGQTVLILGTGGVSVWALQLAQRAGLRCIVTSASADRRAQALALGASAVLDSSAAHWAREVRDLTEGRGADLVLETSGRATLAESMRATRAGGTVAVIGGTSGWGGAIDADALIDGALRLQGVLVGSRRMTEDLVRFVAQTGLRPRIASVHAFDELPQAFAAMGRTDALGKVLLRVSTD